MRFSGSAGRRRAPLLRLKCQVEPADASFVAPAPAGVGAYPSAPLLPSARLLDASAPSTVEVGFSSAAVAPRSMADAPTLPVPVVVASAASSQVVDRRRLTPDAATPEIHIGAPAPQPAPATGARRRPRHVATGGSELRDVGSSEAPSRARPRRGVLRRVGGWLATAAIVLVSLALLGTAGLLFFLHLSVQPVLTGSMRPTFGPGSVVVSRAIPVQAIRPGMVVIFVPPGDSASYAHRVVSVSGSRSHPVLVTKGDANPGPDPWHARIDAPSIQEVVFAVPDLGRLMVAAKGPVAVAGLILLAGLLVGLTGVRSILGTRERRSARASRPAPSGT
jgi:signal peptidase I